MAYRQHSKHPHKRCDSYFVEDKGDSSTSHARVQRALARTLSMKTANQYMRDIRTQMEDTEMHTMPDARAIDALSDTQWAMRYKLLEFLVDIHTAFQLRPETLFLAVNLLDRYCSRRAVDVSNLQLLGCTVVLIAAKYGDNERGIVPSLSELSSACCSLYHASMFIEMEWAVLQALDWALGHPDVYTFLQMALAESNYDPEVKHLSMYIAELALFYREFACVKPSVLSRAALAVARSLLARVPLLVSSSWAEIYDLQTIVGLFQRLYQPPQVLVRKYAFKGVSSASSIAAGCLQGWLGGSDR